jgi:hypothetical protein
MSRMTHADIHACGATGMLRGVDFPLRREPCDAPPSR